MIKNEELTRTVNDNEAKRLQVAQENLELKEVIAEMNESLKEREEEVVNFELELKKHHQKMLLMSEVQQKS